MALFKILFWGLLQSKFGISEEIHEGGNKKKEAVIYKYTFIYIKILHKRFKIYMSTSLHLIIYNFLHMSIPFLSLKSITKLTKRLIQRLRSVLLNLEYQ